MPIYQIGDKKPVIPESCYISPEAVIIGEVSEQTRFFELALAGRDDLLGTRMPGASTGDGVLPVRWMT